MGRPPKTDQYSIPELQAIIAQRKTRLGALRREHIKIAKRLDAIEHEMAYLGGSNGHAIRPRNDKNLIDVMQEVMEKNGKPMRVGDITDAVLAAGYRSSSANFKGIVNQTLIKEKRFRAAARGLYKLD